MHTQLLPLTIFGNSTGPSFPPITTILFSMPIGEHSTVDFWHYFTLFIFIFKWYAHVVGLISFIFKPSKEQNIMLSFSICLQEKFSIFCCLSNHHLRGGVLLFENQWVLSIWLDLIKKPKSLTFNIYPN